MSQQNESGGSCDAACALVVGAEPAVAPIDDAQAVSAHRRLDGSSCRDPIATFEHIITAAKILGHQGSPDRFHFTIEGHACVRERSYGRILSYVPGRKMKVLLHTILACPITRPTRRFRAKIDQANAAVTSTQAIFEAEHLTVRIESWVDCPAIRSEIQGRLTELFRSADEMLGNENLWTALAIGGAVLLGRPAALWDAA